MLERPSQSPDLNLIEDVWKDLKTAVDKRSPSNLTRLELFCKEEWAKVSVSRCAELVETHQHKGAKYRLRAVSKMILSSLANMRQTL